MGDKPSRVIVTRPAQEAAHWVEELVKSGFKAQALPLIQIGPVADPADTALLSAAWSNLSDYAACMFVSGNAVHYFFQQKKAVCRSTRAQEAINNEAIAAINPSLASLRFLAPGPGTAAALLAAGVPAAQVDSPPPQAGQFDSEALWQVIAKQDWRAKRILVVCGKTQGTVDQSATGREWLSEQFLAAGAQVDRLTVYQRSAPRLTQAQIQLAQTASRDGSVWLFSSSEAFANLLQQPLQLGVLHALQGWNGARAIATHPRIAQAVRAAGWGVVRDSRPTLANIVDTLRSIESTLHE